MSQIESFPTEIAAIISDDKSLYTGGLMKLLRSTVDTFGGARGQAKTAFAVDQIAANFLGFGQGAMQQLQKGHILESISVGVGAIDWESFGMTFARGIQWVADAFRGVMLGIGELQPAWTAFANDFMGVWDISTITKMTVGLGNIALLLVKMGAAVAYLGGTVGRFLGMASSTMMGESWGAWGDLLPPQNPADWRHRYPMTNGGAPLRADIQPTQAMMDKYPALRAKYQAQMIDPLNMANDTKALGVQAGAAFPEGFREGAQIHSPSRLMVRAAEQLVAGLELGMAPALQLGTKAGEGVTRAVTNAMSTGGLLGGGGTFAPVFHLAQRDEESAEAFAQRILRVFVDELRGM
jgi:hypothetical protein